jgi:sulfite exporter TauE/SafE
VIELSLVLVGGLLGSAHCLGMCGGLALAVGGGARGMVNNVCRQLAYSLGRIATYAFGGAAAGYTGWRLAAYQPGLRHAQDALAVAAGVALIVLGVRAWRRLTRWRPGQNSVGGCKTGGAVAQVLAAPGLWRPFSAGVLTGFLPCGLVYAYLAVAATTGDLARGAALMAFFGAGTVPLMAAAGLGGGLLTWRSRRRLLQAAAVCVAATGVLTAARGAWSWGPANQDLTSCPACRDAAVP